VGALALYIEDEGVPTSLISLVREHTEAMAPPRALWVPFMLGRPLGAPGVPEFQRRVLHEALRLFERASGPVLEDFPDDAPPDAETAVEEEEGMACPVSFGAQRADATTAERVLGEIEQLRLWHDLGVRRRSRSALGVTGLPLEELVGFIAAWIERGPQPSFRADLVPVDALRQACEEVKAFYLEAAAAQPGTHTSESLTEWFWRRTAVSDLYFELHAATAKSDDPAIDYFSRRSLVPRTELEVRAAAVGGRR